MDFFLNKQILNFSAFEHISIFCVFILYLQTVAPDLANAAQTLLFTCMSTCVPMRVCPWAYVFTCVEDRGYFMYCHSPLSSTLLLLPCPSALLLPCVNTIVSHWPWTCSSGSWPPSTWSLPVCVSSGRSISIFHTLSFLNVESKNWTWVLVLCGLASSQPQERRFDRTSAPSAVAAEVAFLRHLTRNPSERRSVSGDLTMQGQ